MKAKQHRFRQHACSLQLPWRSFVLSDKWHLQKPVAWEKVDFFVGYAPFSPPSNRNDNSTQMGVVWLEEALLMGTCGCVRNLLLLWWCYCRSYHSIYNCVSVCFGYRNEHNFNKISTQCWCWLVTILKYFDEGLLVDSQVLGETVFVDTSQKSTLNQGMQCPK